jgi:hypothetical protein
MKELKKELSEEEKKKLKELETKISELSKEVTKHQKEKSIFEKMLKQKADEKEREIAKLRDEITKKKGSIVVLTRQQKDSSQKAQQQAAEMQKLKVKDHKSEQKLAKMNEEIWVLKSKNQQLQTSLSTEIKNRHAVKYGRPKTTMKSLPATPAMTSRKRGSIESWLESEIARAFEEQNLRKKLLKECESREQVIKNVAQIRRKLNKYEAEKAKTDSDTDSSQDISSGDVIVSLKDELHSLQATKAFHDETISNLESKIVNLKDPNMDNLDHLANDEIKMLFKQIFENYVSSQVESKQKQEKIAELEEEMKEIQQDLKTYRRQSRQTSQKVKELEDDVIESSKILLGSDSPALSQVEKLRKQLEEKNQEISRLQAAVDKQKMPPPTILSAIFNGVKSSTRESSLNKTMDESVFRNTALNLRRSFEVKDRTEGDKVTSTSGPNTPRESKTQLPKWNNSTSSVTFASKDHHSEKEGANPVLKMSCTLSGHNGRVTNIANYGNCKIT